MLEKIIEFLGNPLYSLLLATAIGIVSNILTGKFFERTKRLWWGVSSDYLRSKYFNKTDKLRITYMGLDNKRRKISRSLSVLRFVIWSNGKDTLHNSDISSREPLIISLEPDVEILEVRLIASSNPTIQIKPVERNSILVTFEYLKTNQGITFDVIVFGLATKANLNGVLKEGKVLTKELRQPSFETALPFWSKKWNDHTRLNVAKWLGSIFFILSIWASLWAVSLLRSTTLYFISIPLALLMFVTVLSYFFFVYPFWTTPIVPKELTQFYDHVL